MNTKHLANRMDADGKFYPMQFEETSVKEFALEFALGMAALVAFVCFIIMVSAL